MRPLRQITGEAEFNEIFMEEAEVPDENVIGEVGGGWQVAITTLMFERAGLGAAAVIGLQRGLEDLVALIKEQGPRRTTRSCARRSPSSTPASRRCASAPCAR